MILEQKTTVSTIQNLVDEGFEDFEFMEEGGVHDCKISLMGKFVHEMADNVIHFDRLEYGKTIGNTKYWKATRRGDVYYIFESEMDNYNKEKPLLYYIARKDLIQVDTVIHAECL